MNYILQPKIYTPINMKKALLFLAIGLSLLSCKNVEEVPQTPLSELKSEKELILKKMDSLGLRLDEIEKSISLLDSTKKLQKVTLLTARDTLFNHYISLQGILASDRNIVLTPELGGNITSIYVKEGQKVVAGQKLIQFDNRSVLDQINEIKTQLSLATTTYERQKRLWEQKIGSEMQYLQAKTQKEALENTLSTLNTQLSKLTLRAPFSGIVDEIFAKKGEMAGTATPMLRLINLRKMYIEAEVPEAYLKSIKKGTPVIINFDALGTNLYSKISEVGNFINPENRSFKIRIDIDNRDHKLKPNLLANLQINDFSAKGVVLPKHIIQMNSQGDTYVFTIEKNSNRAIVKKMLLDLNKEYNNEVLIKNGLNGGESLVNEGGKFVKEGDQVLIIE